MIKVSVLYAYEEGARFDHDYYRDRHMPLVQELMGKYCKGYSVDRGIGGATPGSDPVYIGMCHIYCDSIEDFEAGMGPHSKQINADIINYTDLIPEIQISEVRADVKTAQ
ncbi:MULTISPECIES: EthD family reductase [Pseudomonas]|jgi:uncharacterized protein (TIGR02118 family)|uniref:EthD n=7 Tax=Pseudomonas syringae group TaxID=136849 RepID=F3G850_PSESJ|nr:MULTISPECIES: EthD family reductase [Pseudomonas]EGH43250.1 EthD [Pseudomonas syringae pv. pisi str. 1704B]ALU59958.1 ethyl tert-butyl ether degradation protein EthD [Pseudomonas syringae pv. lapsa]KPX66183.1 EthD [Pseudomonas syringae pv. lapsa]KTB98238.1 ethyl tert-butyl ether degradation protein EthD [Pseudomonas syringae ICMP 11168]MBI6719844.1 EthD family reductase [Pseudomonas syringae]